MPYVHNTDPFALRITESFGVRWYGLAYLAGFLAGYFLILYLGRRGLTNLESSKVGDFVFTVALGTIIGGRLGYCIFYSPDLFSSFTDTFPYWGVLAINQGGMASHGGIAGIFLAASYFAWRNGLSRLHLTDLTTLGGTLGVFFGRIANFVNGELVGRPCPPNLPWAVKFPQDIYTWPARAPERLSGLEQTVSALGISQSEWQKLISEAHRSPVAWNKISSTLDQIIVAVQNGNEPVTLALGKVLDPRHPSQLYAALLEGALVFTILLTVWLVKPRKPGVITALFFILYALVRILGEEFRMPDIQIGFQALGLTRGQWLSVVLLLLGLLALYFWSRRDVKPIELGKP